MTCTQDKGYQTPDVLDSNTLKEEVVNRFRVVTESALHVPCPVSLSQIIFSENGIVFNQP